jgi:predicted amidohydrolase YtcJ
MTTYSIHQHCYLAPLLIELTTTLTITLNRGKRMKKNWYSLFSAMAIGVGALYGAAYAQADPASSTTHFVNANGYTLTSKGDLLKFSEFVINNDRIVSVGESNDINKNSVRIDLKGKTVLPGLIDAHGHILGLGESLMKVDLRGSTSEQEAVSRVLQFVGKHPLITNMNTANKNKEERWLNGDGWNQVLWASNSFPKKESLDAALPDIPIVLSRVDGHAVWVNSKALSLAGINSNTRSPSGGEIIKDANGEPTGVLIDNAMSLLANVMPQTTPKELNEYLQAATNHLLSLGITSAHDAGISKSVRDFYVQKANDNQLGFRIYAMLGARDPDIIEMLKAGHFADKNGFLSIRSVKAYGDGALGSRGAALLAPYSDDPKNVGLLLTPEERLPSLFNTVIGANFQLNIHAIGDRANRLALHQFNDSFQIFPENAERHRIEHAQIVNVDDIPLFKKYGVIPSMQPTHATSDMNMAEDRLGKARLKGAYAWQTFLKQGSRIALGSDFPVELANAFHGLHAAVSRQNADQEPKDGWLPSESLTRIQALKGFTIDAAYAAFQENLLGSIEAGKKADFIVIDKDYFEVPVKDIRDIQVLATYVNGNKVYEAL